MQNALSSVLDFVVAIEEKKSADEVWNAFRGFSGAFGLPFAALVNVPRAGETLADTALYLSCPGEWHRRYFERNYFRDDPAALHMARSTDPYCWRELLALPHYTKVQRQVVHEAGEFGMHEGFVVPLVGPGARAAIIEVAGANKELAAREKVALRLAAVCAHSKLQAIWKPRNPSLPPLSHREREVLQWAAMGKSDWEIGEILSISEKTANAHIENVKRKYGVTSRIHAVVKGMNSHAINV